MQGKEERERKGASETQSHFSSNGRGSRPRYRI
jgi:hypothetical protein